MTSAAGSELLRQAHEGSPEAMSALFARYGGRLHALIRMRLGPHLRRRLESRDVLQVTLLRAFQGLDRFDGSGSRSFMAWLGAIAQAEICDQADYHGRGKRDMARETALTSRADPVAEQLRSEVSRLQLEADLERLLVALDTLVAKQREAVLLRSLEELSFNEVGERMGKSPDACRMLYTRALANLAERM
jgi:RNA polymerase sigma-70 factor, ECF subfamily